jgi:hypothetical protein
VKKSCPLFLLIALCAAPLFSASLEELTGSQRAAILRGSPVNEVQLKNPWPVLLPGHEGVKRLIGEIQQNLQPSIMVEALYLYQKPQLRSVAERWSESERIGLFNQFIALSTLAGIQYFSASRNEMRTLYETSQIIDGPDSKRAVADPVLTAVPPSLTQYARQKDLTFGENIYRYDFFSFPDAMIFVQENLTALNAGIIPAVGKNRLKSVMAVFDCGDSLLIYTASMAKTTPIPGMGDRIGDSFLARAEAILKWFTDRAEGVFGK